MEREATEQEIAKRRREAIEFGCFGLIDGIAKNLYTHKQYHATSSVKSDGPFYCAACYSDAVIRKCTQKVDHFAHRARLSPVIGPKESDLHRQCKVEILEALQERYREGNWDIERPIPENKKMGIPELRPDISGRIRGIRVAIEVQASTLTVPRIVKRAKSYSARDIALLWIVPLHKPLGELPFRPRLYERYLHSIYFGRTYYWWPGQRLTLKLVHYGPAIRHVEYREWYEDAGQQMDAGGYDTIYKLVKQPIYGRDANIADDFVRESRDEFVPENERKAVPRCLIWRDQMATWWNDAP